MFEFVKAVQDALRIQSTWAFTLVMAAAFAVVFSVVGGVLGFVAHKSYLNHLKDNTIPKVEAAAVSPGTPPAADPSLPPQTPTQKKTGKTSQHATPVETKPSTAPFWIQAQKAIVNELVQKFINENGRPPTYDWVNQQLQAQGRDFRIQPPPHAVLNDVHINSFGTVGLGVAETATVEMKGNSSVTNNQVGIENHGRVIMDDNASVSGNKTGIVNNANPKQEEPKVKPPPEK
jgi:hypothetical protein